MTGFQYYFHPLPCFNCKKYSKHGSWLPLAMKEDVLAQVVVIIKQGDVEPDLSVNVTCTKDDARDYLLLNFYCYSEEELENQVEAEDEKEVADEIVGLS